MRKILILQAALLVSVAAFVSGDRFTSGPLVALDAVGRPSLQNLQKEFDSDPYFNPGFWWEVSPQRTGFGMTDVVGFLPGIPALPLAEYQSWFDWIATFDLRHHFLAATLLDPFVELGVGNAGRAHILKTQATAFEPEKVLLSIFAQVGVGMSVVVARELHIGLKAAYRFSTMPVPGTGICQYPLRRYQLVIYCGW